MSSPEHQEKPQKIVIEKMDPEIIEKMLFHRSYKAPGATATQLAAATRKAASVGGRNKLTSAGSAIMSPTRSQKSSPPPWCDADTSHELETGEIPIILGNHDDMMYQSKQLQRQLERQSQSQYFQQSRNNSLAPPRLGRGTHIERMSAARRGETYYSMAKPPRKQVGAGVTSQWSGGTPAGYKPYQHVQKLTKKQQERYDRTHCLQNKTQTVQDENTEEDYAEDESTQNGDDKMQPVSANQKMTTNMKPPNPSVNTNGNKQLYNPYDQLPASQNKKGNNITSLQGNNSRGHSRGGVQSSREGVHRNRFNMGSTRQIRTPEPNVRRQRSEIQSLRLRVDLLWDELYVPTRDRQAVLKATVKNEKDAIDLLSGHLHVLLAHKRNTLAVLDLIRVREEILALLMSKCDFTFMANQRRASELAKIRKQEKIKQLKEEKRRRESLAPMSPKNQKKTLATIHVDENEVMHTVPEMVSDDHSSFRNKSESCSVSLSSSIIEDEDDDLSSIHSNKIKNSKEINPLNDLSVVDDSLEEIDPLNETYLKSTEEEDNMDHVIEEVDKDTTFNYHEITTNNNNSINSANNQMNHDNTMKTSDLIIDENNVSSQSSAPSSLESSMKSNSDPYPPPLSNERSSSGGVLFSDDEDNGEEEEKQELTDEEKMEQLNETLKHLLAQLLLISAQTVQAILEWRTSLWRPLPFSYRKHGNYMIKMCHDVQYFLKDQRTSKQLEELIMLVKEPAAIAMMQPTQQSHFNQAPPIDYIRIVADMTAAATNLSSQKKENEGKNSEENVLSPTNREEHRNSENEANKDNDEEQEKEVSGDAIEIATNVMCGNVFWNVAQVLSMEEMIMQQIDMEAKIRKSNNSFIPLLKPVSAFLNHQQVQRPQEQLDGSSISNHPHHPLEPPNPIGFDKLIGVSSSSATSQSSTTILDDHLTQNNSTKNGSLVASTGNEEKEVEEREGEAKLSKDTLESSSTLSNSNTPSNNSNKDIKSKTQPLSQMENKMVKTKSKKAYQISTVFDLNLPLILYYLYPDQFLDPIEEQRNADEQLEQERNKATVANVMSMVDTSKFTQQELLQLQMQLQNQQAAKSGILQVPGFNGRFPAGHGTSTATGSSIGIGDEESSVRSTSTSVNDVESQDGSVSRNSGVIDVGFGDVFGGGSYGRGLLEHEQHQDELMEGGFNNTDELQKNNNDHHHHHHHSSSHKKQSKHHKKSSPSSPQEEDVDYDEILLSKVRDDKTIVQFAQRLIPREMSDSIHIAVTKAVLGNVFSDADESDSGVLHVKELFPVIAQLATSIVRFDEGELGSFVENSVSLAQCMLYARVYDENCMVTQEDFPDYLRTLLVMCWLSTLPDHGLELLKHCHEKKYHHHHHHHHQHQHGTTSKDQFSSSNHSVKSSTHQEKGISSNGLSESFDSKWEEVDEIELNSRLPSTIEAHWNAEYGQYYFYNSETDVTSWECPIGNVKKQNSPQPSSSSVMDTFNDDSEDVNLFKDFISNDKNSTMVSNIDDTARGNTGDGDAPIDNVSLSSTNSKMKRVNENEVLIETDETDSKHQQDDELVNTNKETCELLAKIAELELKIESLTLKNKTHFDEEIEIQSPMDKHDEDKINNLQNHQTENTTHGTEQLKQEEEEEEEEIPSSSTNTTAASTNENVSEIASFLSQIPSLPRKEKHFNNLPANLNKLELEYLVNKYNRSEVHGLNIDSFHTAVTDCMLKTPGTMFTQSDLPRLKDMDKAFHLADEDKSGVVDFDEFISLYSKIKAGEVDGLAGYGFFERRKKKKNKVQPTSS